MSSPRPINMDFRYEDTDYADLMHAYVKQKGLKLSADNRGIILNADGSPRLRDGQIISFWDVLVIHETSVRPAAKLNAFKEYLRHIVEWLRAYPTDTKHTLLIPFNTITGHWSLLKLQLDLATNRMDVFLLDSSGNLESDLKADLQEIAKVIHVPLDDEFKIDDFNGAIIPLSKQPDDNSCGPIVATMMAFEAGLDEIQFPDNNEAYPVNYSPADISIIRQKHAQLRGGDFQQKQHANFVIDESTLAKPPSHDDEHIDKLAQEMLPKVGKLFEAGAIANAFVRFVTTEQELMHSDNSDLKQENSKAMEQIKALFREDFSELKKILEKFFEINGDIAPTEFKWLSGGRDTLTAVLHNLCIKQGLIEADIDQNHTEGPFYGIAFGLFAILNLKTYFMGQPYEDDKFATGSIKCIILGDEPLGQGLYLCFDGKLEDGKACGPGKLRVYNSAGEIITTIVAMFDDCLLETLKVTGDHDQVATAVAYFDNNSERFALLSQGKTPAIVELNSIEQDAEQNEEPEELMRSLLTPSPGSFITYKSATEGGNSRCSSVNSLSLKRSYAAAELVAELVAELDTDSEYSQSSKSTRRISPPELR